MRFDSEHDFMKDGINIDLTPLIDVIFMLVIFFILTMSFSKPVLDIVLPQTKSQLVAKPQEMISITIKNNGLYYYEGEEVKIADIKVLLEKNPLLELNIFPDKDIKFQDFIDLVDLAQEKRAGRFSITAIKDNASS